MAKSASLLFRVWSIVAVSSYLLGAYVFLRSVGRLKPHFSVFKIFRMPIRRKYQGPLSRITAEIGFCYAATVPAGLISDRDGFSRLQVYEDGYPLPTKGANHDRVRSVGYGSFSHWGEVMYFSASDNSDPRTNGRSYSVREV